ncbi:MAG: hypothetical protein V3V13_09905 [Paracoccaceae bacterium]
MRTSMVTRISKLEHAHKQVMPRSTVVYYDPETDEIIGVPRMAQKIMLVPVWSTDQAWEVALSKQQRELVARA